MHLQFRYSFAVRALYKGQPEQRRQPRKFNATQIDRALSCADQPRDRAEMAQQRHKELTGQGCADAAGGFARLQVRVLQNRKEVESASPKCEPVNRAEFQIARRIDADEKQIGVIRMEGNEVSNVSFKAADLLSTGIERMNQADLVSGFDAAGITCAQRQR